MADSLSRIVAWPSEMTLAVGECGRPNAYYRKDRRAIVLCYEFLDQLLTKFPTDPRLNGKTESEKMQLSMGAFAFVLVHELAHAMIDMFELPVLGREEDVADQIATHTLISSGLNDLALLGAVMFFDKGRSAFYIQSHGELSDEHGLDKQRSLNIACWAFGLDPSRFGALARYVGLSSERAPRCSNEYRQLDRGVRNLLEAHLVKVSPRTQPARPSASKATKEWPQARRNPWTDDVDR
jgi:hypothetical protein